MYLHEAIKQAGEGGKIYRKGLIGQIGVGAVRLYDAADKEIKPYTENLTADDWEVVPPEIEVGDVVRVWGGREGTVIGIDRIPEKQVCIQWDDTSMTITPYDQLTLVRKGPKREVFEGVRLFDYNEHGELLLGGQGLKNKSDDVNSFIGNLRMTLEEM